MNHQLNGELVPNGGGDPIPLIRDVLVLGRRESCDVRMPFPNVSGRHCELSFRKGYWYIRDLNSTNGIKVNGMPVQNEKLLHPSDEVTIGKRVFQINYKKPAGSTPLEEEDEDIMGRSLMEKAGLEKPKRPAQESRRRPLIDPAEFLLQDDDD
jgi:pSer/pThr/pTyr-binding forkhead associated (FHA) protein